MAKAAAKTNGATKHEGGMPAGYTLLTDVMDANWMAAQKGNICEGIMLGRHPINQEPIRYYYQVELTRPCLVRVGKGDDAEVSEVPAGEVVNVNETKRLECLKDVVIPEILAGAKHSVFIEYGEKIKIGGGKTMWKVDVANKRLSGPIRPVLPLPVVQAASGVGEGEGAPF